MGEGGRMGKGNRVVGGRMGERGRMGEGGRLRVPCRTGNRVELGCRESRKL